MANSMLIGLADLRLETGVKPNSDRQPPTLYLSLAAAISRFTSGSDLMTTFKEKYPQCSIYRRNLFPLK